MYSDNHQNAVIYLKNTKVNLNNILIMTGDLHIRDLDWDLSCLYHSLHTKTLLEIVDSLGLQLSNPTNPGPTQYIYNPLDTNTVIDLMFLQHNSSALHNHSIASNIQKLSDHAPLIVELTVYEENNQSIRSTVVKNSDKESEFLKNLVYTLNTIDTTNIHSSADLEDIVNNFAKVSDML